MLSALESLEPFDGKSLVAAAREGVDALRTKKTLRKFSVTAPTPLKPAQIAGIRSSLNSSQAVFAAYLGVSKAAVVAWEYGSRQPSGAALRLLAIAKRNPQILVEMNSPPSTGGNSEKISSADFASLVHLSSRTALGNLACLHGLEFLAGVRPLPFDYAQKLRDTLPKRRTCCRTSACC